LESENLVLCRRSLGTGDCGSVRFEIDSSGIEDVRHGELKDEVEGQVHEQYIVAYLEFMAMV
jgi:hypothetical protein